jgi:sugar lactone lactonase YvrE
MNVLAAEKPICVWNAGRLLGEGVWWSIEEGAVYWVDIKRPAILRYHPATSETCHWPVPELIGCCAPRSAGGLVAAFVSGIYSISLGAPGTQPDRTLIAAPEMGDPSIRFNDGCVAPDGTFWAGTMDDTEQTEQGWFWRLSQDHRLTPMAGPYGICNGPAFSPDGQTVYLTDSMARTIYRLNWGQQDRPSVFFVLDPADGYPDGMTTDSEGRLWVACWDASKVLCLSPEGVRIGAIKLPTSRPTRCAFGGPDFKTLYVSTASIGLTPGQLAQEQLAGGLFAISLKHVGGFATASYSG